MSENEKELGAELPELPEADAAAAAEEAAEYYDNINKELDEELSESASKGEEPERTEERFSFGFDINDELTEELYEFPKERGGSLIFYAACTFVAAAFLCTSFYLGAGKTADSEETQRVLELMSASDAEYAAALEENEALSAELSELSSRRLELRELASSVGDYEETKKSLEERLAAAKADFQSKNDELYSLNQEIAALKSQDGKYTVTLTPGVYAVGENLPAGTYNITGEGSIIGATAAGETKINMQLSPDEANSAELRSGYTVKINRTTTFTLSQASE